MNNPCESPCEPTGSNHGARPPRALVTPVQPRMAGHVKLSRDNEMASEECVYHALSRHLEGLEDLERRQIWTVKEQDYTREQERIVVYISESIKDIKDDTRIIKWEVLDDVWYERLRNGWTLWASMATVEKSCLAQNGCRVYDPRDVHTTGSSTAETNKREAETTESDGAAMRATLDEAPEVQEKSVKDSDASESLSMPGGEREQSPLTALTPV